MAAEPAGGTDAEPTTPRRGPHPATTEALAHLSDREVIELTFEHVAAIYRTTVQLDEVVASIANGGGGMFGKLLSIAGG